ncbi:hypothetical protein LP419_40680 [Massilia sp. H-1]|nr:hypothetical protein LP419_40680 [Massilia sp. H-1]
MVSGWVMAVTTIVSAFSDGAPVKRTIWLAPSRAEFAYVAAVILTGMQRVFAQVENAAVGTQHGAVGKQRRDAEVAQAAVILEGARNVGRTEFMASHVVQRFFGGAVFVQLPGHEMIEGVPVDLVGHVVRMGFGARFREHFFCSGRRAAPALSSA